MNDQVYQLDRVLGERMPMFVTSEPGIFHPNHPMTTVLAKISPKPNMTPFTNGRSMFIASDDRKAETRVRAGRVESKIVSVADWGGAWVPGLPDFLWISREDVLELSGKDMDG